MEFQEGSPYVHTNTVLGIVTADELTRIEDLSVKNDLLISYGLTPDEVQLYNDYKKGWEHLESLHKNYEKSLLLESINAIEKKIQSAQANRENGLSASCPVNEPKEKLLHPMNNLEELKNDLFPDEETNDSISHSKRRKYLRRMNRKLAETTCLPEPTEPKENPHFSKNIIEHNYNDFIIMKDRTSSEYKPSSRKSNSKWDVKEVSLPVRSSPTKTRSKIIGCSEQKLFTVKEGKIVQIKKQERVVDDETQCAKYPEGYKLSLNEIEETKFKNYDPGNPSQNLFIKNIVSSVLDQDIKAMLVDDKELISIRMMTGRMKGQAFATFETSQGASKALDKINGVVLKGKPIIVQFGKSSNG